MTLPRRGFRHEFPVRVDVDKTSIGDKLCLESPRQIRSVIPRFAVPDAEGLVVIVSRSITGDSASRLIVRESGVVNAAGSPQL
jgi:hypothetical protein